MVIMVIENDGRLGTKHVLVQREGVCPLAHGREIVPLYMGWSLSHCAQMFINACYS